MSNNLNDKIMVMNHEKYYDFIYNHEDKETIHFVLIILDTGISEYSEEYLAKLRKIFRTDYNIQRVKSFKINDDESSHYYQYKLLAKYVNAYKEYLDSGLDIKFILSGKGGVCRSPAITAAILRYFRLNGYKADETIIFENGNFTPNMYAYKLFCKALGVPITEEELNYLETINLEA